MLRNNTIDILKFICAFLVILNHACYPYKDAVLPITEIAVPLFFCISGFFIFGRGCNASRIKRIAIIIAWSFVLYFAKTELYHLAIMRQAYFLSVNDWINLLIFNDVAFAIHLWYLPAYLYTLFVVYAIEKYNKWNLSFYFIIPLLVIGTIIKMNVPGPQIQYHRNFLFLGLPYVLAGALLRSKLGGNCLNACKLKKLMGGVCCLVVLLLVIRYIVPDGRIWSNFVKDADLFLLVVCIFLFVLLIRDTKVSVWTKLGKDYSLYIYIFHLVILSALEMLQSHLNANLSVAYSYIHPLIILTISIAVTYCLKKVKVIT